MQIFMFINILLEGHEFKQAPGVGDGQGGLCAVVHGVTKSWTWLSDWTELNILLSIRRVFHIILFGGWALNKYFMAVWGRDLVEEQSGSIQRSSASATKVRQVMKTSHPASENLFIFFFFLRVLKRDLNLLTGLLQTKLGPEKELSITFWPQRNHRKSQPVCLECIWQTIPGLLIWYLELPKNPPEISFYLQFNGITPKSYQNHKWIL